MPDKTGLSHLGMSAMDSAAEGITISRITDPDQPLVYVNDGFLQMTGLRREDCIGRNCRFLQGPDTDPETVMQLRVAIKSRQATSVEFLNYKKDKTPFWNRLTIAPIADQPGADPDYYVGVQCDITENKLLEAKLKHTADRFENINQMAEESLKKFTADIGHRTNEVLEQIETICDDKNGLDVAALRQLVAKTRESAQQTNQLIAGMKVIMENCGGIAGLRDIDPITLNVRR